ncbi:LacI family DNA-binding transcriptional regulator [Asticcacaulis sp. 201]|uniref:LacI family DNA-binding transcriptional regulator n=1 Tax=Asticcacaulis sp. 201 TaxID=3028787 RepID=UPI00291620EB|nr:LacI family DNA-binding transcriptional regulator [Asticcacaulis sp. 201]MDV6331622.1 LacI family DNA-binding transcriptional regulator [Asticcacaulis sp. 201]
MATIYDVAALAGVSAKTVSRVLNDDSAVKAGTREKVLDAMSRLDYRPNTQARQLRLGARTSVGFLLEDPTSGYQGRFHHAMLTACMESGKYLAVELYEAGMPDWQAYLDRFITDAEIKDMVLLPTLCDFGPLKSFLKSRGIHCVLISPSTPDSHYPSVAMDDRLAARDVVEYLFQLGHRKIAHIGGHPDHAASILRRNGFYEAFDAAGLPRPPAHYVEHGNFLFKSGFEAAERLLGLKDRPTAIFACNDEMAAAACSVAHKMQLRLPEDIAIVGFDDAPISSSVWPTLTTVRQPYLEMARRSIQIFNTESDTLIASDRQIRHIIAHEIIERETTLAPALDKPQRQARGKA